MLTVEQVESFKRDGVLALRQFFAADEVNRWQGQIQDYFGSPTTGEEWRAALVIHKVDSFYLKPDPTPVAHRALSSLYTAFHRTARWEGENELVLRPGEDEAPWLGARAPHLDFPFAMPVRTLANNVLYLSDVEPFGGAFMYWPGSHRVAWEYFRRNPADYLAQGERGQDSVFERLVGAMPNGPVEFTGRAGDLLIWNSLLLHSGSANKRLPARAAIFGRWGVPLEDEPFYDFAADMWSYWDFDPR